MAAGTQDADPCLVLNHIWAREHLHEWTLNTEPRGTLKACQVGTRNKKVTEEARKAGSSATVTSTLVGYQDSMQTNLALPPGTNSLGCSRAVPDRSYLTQQRLARRVKVALCIWRRSTASVYMFMPTCSFPRHQALDLSSAWAIKIDVHVTDRDPGNTCHSKLPLFDSLC